MCIGQHRLDTKWSVAFRTNIWFLSTMDYSCAFSRQRFSENFLLQVMHTNGFSPVWIHFMMELQSNFLVRTFCHTLGHANVFSLLCVYMWDFKPALDENCLWHSEHATGFSPLWIVIWRARPSLRRNCPATFITNKTFLRWVWVLTCRYKFDLWLNFLPHSWQTYGFPPWV